jgi:hypothetical protein
MADYKVCAINSAADCYENVVIHTYTFYSQELTVIPAVVGLQMDGGLLLSKYQFIAHFLTMTCGKDIEPKMNQRRTKHNFYLGG